jgi:hypothetical protein
MQNFYKTNSGLSILGFVFLGLIIILVLSYFKISVRTVVESPEAQDNLNYVGGGTVSLWEKYFKGPATYLWNDIWLELFWRPFVDNMKKLSNGEPSDIEQEVPTVSY